MPGAGWSNPFPLRFGGGPTATDAVYRAMRSAVGKGGSPKDPDRDLLTIVELWRACKARVIAAVRSFDERAMLQAFPDKATDLLPYYERTLLPDADPTATDEQRRNEVRAQWIVEVGGNEGAMLTALQALDSRFHVFTIDDAKTTTTVFGRAFEDYAAAEPFGDSRKATLFPNYSTNFVFTGVLDLGGAAPEPADKRVLAAALRLLSDSRPAWEEIQLVIDDDGFDLDFDFLDYTLLT